MIRKMNKGEEEEEDIEISPLTLSSLSLSLSSQPRSLAALSPDRSPLPPSEHSPCASPHPAMASPGSGEGDEALERWRRAMQTIMERDSLRRLDLFNQIDKNHDGNVSTRAAVGRGLAAPVDTREGREQERDEAKSHRAECEDTAHCGARVTRDEGNAAAPRTYKRNTALTCESKRPRGRRGTALRQRAARAEFQRPAPQQPSKP